MSAAGREGSASEKAGQIYRQHPDVTVARYGDDGLVVVPRNADQIVLNDVATRVVELADGERSVAAIRDTLLDEYDNADADRVLKDVVEILEDLEERGVVVPA
jgi:hypothetical protein